MESKSLQISINHTYYIRGEKYNNIKLSQDLKYNLGFLNIILQNTIVRKEVINIEDCFEKKQKFTKEITSNEFNKLDNKLKQLQIHITDIQIATNDEEYEYYTLMNELLYQKEKNNE